MSNVKDIDVKINEYSIGKSRNDHIRCKVT